MTDNALRVPAKVSSIDIELRPAAMLEGVELEGGWIVGQRLPPSKWSSGGLFSFGYEAQHPEFGEAFLKALDYSEALASQDVPRALKRLTDAYVHERELLERCREANLSRVVMPLAHGQISLPGQLVPVNYLIFERAEGDVRNEFAAMKAFDLAWVMRVLHGTAVGIQQLHRQGIVHQDVKPSNVVLFSDGEVSKIADLERAEAREVLGPFSEEQIAGDWTYAPIEHLYGFRAPDWGAGRRGCDLYHLGSMISFFFIGMATTPAILSRLDPTQYPGQWGDSFEAVLPYVRSAFDDSADAIEGRLPALHRERLSSAFRELCDPEPERRGHPKARSASHSDRFAVDRYVTLFDLVAKRAERQLQGNEP